MDTTTLATFRIDKKTWKKFKKWAGEKNSNASAELNQFVLRSLGLIDENLDTESNNDLQQRIDSYLDKIIDERIEKAVNVYLDNNIDKRIYNLTTEYLNQEQETDIESDLNSDTEISIDTHIDNKQVEELDTNIDNCIDKEEPLTESLQEQSNEQITNAELARRIKVSPSTVSKWANQKSRPPKNLEWEYNSKLKKWVK